MKELNEFFEYVKSFYGIDGIYPINCKEESIFQSCALYYGNTANTEDWGYGDSLDRERVRDILFNKGFTWI